MGTKGGIMNTTTLHYHRSAFVPPFFMFIEVLKYNAILLKTSLSSAGAKWYSNAFARPSSKFDVGKANGRKKKQITGSEFPKRGSYSARAVAASFP